MAVKHTQDSLSVLPHLPSSSQLNVLDVGTGGGFPGIPLAIAKPKWQFTLVDCSAKKVRFLNQVIATLKLPNVTAIHTRIESYEPPTLFDGIISRAFASLDDMVSLTKHLLKPEGYYYAMKGLESEQIPNETTLVDVIKLTVPNLDAARQLVILKRS
jgi:16S rRNA (guanine527-N7)-methyltransferase